MSKQPAVQLCQNQLSSFSAACEKISKSSPPFQSLHGEIGGQWSLSVSGYWIVIMTFMSLACVFFFFFSDIWNQTRGHEVLYWASLLNLSVRRLDVRPQKSISFYVFTKFLLLRYCVRRQMDASRFYWCICKEPEKGLNCWHTETPLGS